MIKKQIGKATKIISDLLDISKIKQGRLTLNKEYFDLNLLVKEVIDQIQQLNNLNRIVFTKGDDALLHADKEKIGQVVTKLLSNALKYSADGSIVRVKSKVKDNKMIISITDYGIGIKDANQRKIFERFYRVEEGKDECRFPGFGIGLFTTAEIIRQHEGVIGVISEPEKGSVFYFSLPCV